MLERMFKRPAFVLNVGCGAVVLWEEAVYGRPAPQNSGTTRVCTAAQPFVTFDDVDYLFTQFPKTLDLGRASLLKKTRVQVLPLAAEQIMTAPDNLVGMSDRLTLAGPSPEGHTRTMPPLAAGLFREPAGNMARTKFGRCCSSRRRCRGRSWNRQSACEHGCSRLLMISSGTSRHHSDPIRSTPNSQMMPASPIMSDTAAKPAFSVSAIEPGDQSDQRRRDQVAGTSVNDQDIEGKRREA